MPKAGSNCPILRGAVTTSVYYLASKQNESLYFIRGITCNHHLHLNSYATSKYKASF